MSSHFCSAINALGAGGSFSTARNTGVNAVAACVSSSPEACVSASVPESLDFQDCAVCASSPPTKCPKRIPEEEEMQRGGGSRGAAAAGARGTMAAARDGGGFGRTGQTDRFGRTLPRPGQGGRQMNHDGYYNDEEEARMERGGNVGMGFAVRERDVAPGRGQGKVWPRPGRGARGFGRGFDDRRGAHNQYGGRHGGAAKTPSGVYVRTGRQTVDVSQGGDTMMEEAEGVEGVEGEGISSGIRCARCTKKGHVAAKCTNEIYCVICDGHDHVNHRCPVLKMPRPVAHAVGYAVHGLGFYHIPHPPLSRAKKDTKMALIRVTGGQLSMEQVMAQMCRIFPGKWRWELEAHEENAFITKFPSKTELQRSVAFGGADVFGEGCPPGIRLQFTEWHGKKEGYLLPKIWVRVFGLRKELREFLEL